MRPCFLSAASRASSYFWLASSRILKFSGLAHPFCRMNLRCSSRHSHGGFPQFLGGLGQPRPGGRGFGDHRNSPACLGSQRIPERVPPVHHLPLVPVADHPSPEQHPREDNVLRLQPVPGVFRALDDGVGPEVHGKNPFRVLAATAWFKDLRGLPQQPRGAGEVQLVEVRRPGADHPALFFVHRLPPELQVEGFGLALQPQRAADLFWAYLQEAFAGAFLQLIQFLPVHFPFLPELPGSG